MTNNGDQTNAGGDQSIRVAITPTWEAVAKISVEALLNGTTNGQSMAREEIIDLGIKLDDAKEIIEERLKPTPSLQVQFGETEALIEEKDKTIAELKERVDKLGKTIDNLIDERDEWQKADEHNAGLRKVIKKDLEQTLAFKNQTIVNLEEAKRELQKYWEEKCPTTGIARDQTEEDPVHEQIVDVIHASKVAKTN